MPKIFIDGEYGTTGLSLRERLQSDNFDVISLEWAQRKDIAARLDAMRKADLTVLCLPDDAAREIVLRAQEHGTCRLLDASSAHRLASGWVYGFAELNANQSEKIARAMHVANPGCYPTGAIALLRPLVDDGLVAKDTPLTINAVSGYSGGGRTQIERHQQDHGPAFELYGLSLSHKHLPEITHYSGLTVSPVFVPSVGHFAQGMIVSIPLHRAYLQRGATVSDVRACLEKRYRETAPIRFEQACDARLDAEALAQTDMMELRVYASADGGQILLVARLDNLGKGAAGAAMQNIRLMLNASNAQVARAVAS